VPSRPVMPDRFGVVCPLNQEPGIPSDEEVGRVASIIRMLMFSQARQGAVEVE
jgi:hypothetical protein